MTDFEEIQTLTKSVFFLRQVYVRFWMKIDVFDRKNELEKILPLPEYLLTKSDVAK
jgi:hypothetical protein